ncbi:MAG: hypothetical protein NDJ94_19245 [Vicinamibacteria bacterium]|nr:hypothetical protein [Vicinamibacteria bacterium]
MTFLPRAWRYWLTHPNESVGMALAGLVASLGLRMAGFAWAAWPAWAFAALMAATMLNYLRHDWRELLKFFSAFVLGVSWLFFAVGSPSLAKGGLLRAWLGHALVVALFYAWGTQLLAWWNWPQRWRAFLHRLVVDRAFERELWPLASCILLGLAMTLFDTNKGASAVAALPALVLVARAWMRALAAGRLARAEMLQLIAARDLGDEWRGQWRGQGLVVEIFGGGRHAPPSHTLRAALATAPVEWTFQRDAEGVGSISAPPEWQERLAALPALSLLAARPALFHLASRPSRGEVEARLAGPPGGVDHLRANLDAIFDACALVAAAR